MRGRRRVLVASLVLVAVLGGLVLVFPRAAAFAELAARELRYFWWLVLIVALAGWLIWGFRRKPDK
jgi:uncharacterized membrane-anchored protein